MVGTFPRALPSLIIDGHTDRQKLADLQVWDSPRGATKATPAPLYPCIMVTFTWLAMVHCTMDVPTLSLSIGGISLPPIVTMAWVDIPLNFIKRFATLGATSVETYSRKRHHLYFWFLRNGLKGGLN